MFRQARGLPKEFVGGNTLVTPSNFINWSCKLTLFQREVVGDSTYKVRGVDESTKQ